MKTILQWLFSYKLQEAYDLGYRTERAQHFGEVMQIRELYILTQSDDVEQSVRAEAMLSDILETLCRRPL